MKPSASANLSWGERLLPALFAAVAPAVVAAALLHLAPPPGLTPLSQRPMWVAWTLIGVWLMLATALSLAGRQDASLWRWALGLLAALLALVALATVMAGLPLAGPMVMACGGLALCMLGLARCIGPQRVRAERARPEPAPPGPAQPLQRAGVWRRTARHLVRHAGFWLCGALTVESFRLAHIVAVDPQRGVGMVGMLLGFFVLLPAVSLAPWFPRVAALLSLTTAAGLAGLAWRSGLASPALLALPLLPLAAQQLRSSWRTARAARSGDGAPRAHDGRSDRHAHAHNDTHTRTHTHSAQSDRSMAPETSR